MANWERACMSTFLIALIWSGGFSEPRGQNQGEPNPYDQNEGGPEYVPRVLEFFGKSCIIIKLVNCRNKKYKAKI